MSRKKTPSQPEPDGKLQREEAAAENAEAKAEGDTEAAAKSASDANAAAGDGAASGGESEVAEASTADGREATDDEATAGDDTATGNDTGRADDTGTADEAKSADATALVARAARDDEAEVPDSSASGAEAVATDETALGAGSTGTDETASADDATGADEATSADASATSEPDASGDSARPIAARVGRKRPARLGAAVAFLAAAGVATAAAVLWWQFLQGYVSGEGNRAAVDSGVESTLLGDGDDVAAGAGGDGIEAALRSLDARIAALGEELNASRAELEVRVDRAEALLENLPARFAALERRVNAVQGSTREARENLLREEAEYYLTLANTELHVAGRWDSAISALQIADDTLRELGNPALRPVREAIADELIALNSVELTDIEGVVITLGRLLEQAPELPLRPGGPNRFAAPETGLEDAEPGLDRLWLGVRNALRSVVSVERREAPVAPVLTAAEQQLARRQLQLELQLARLAATGARQEAFSAGVIAARALLEQDFDAESVAVRNAVALLDELRQTNVAPVRPDIGGSLTVLRALAAEGE